MGWAGRWTDQGGISRLDDVAAFPSGDVLISGADCVRKLSPSGELSTVAGECIGIDDEDTVFGGDGGPATSAELENPGALSVTEDGGFLVVDGDLEAPRIRRVAPDGTISTVAGTGVRGRSGDGRVTAVPLGTVTDLDALPDGGFLFSEGNARRVRRVYPDGRIETVAGTGRVGFAGDGGPATEALLGYPAGGMADDFFIADGGNGRIRRVAPDGVISTVAGGGEIERGLRADRAGLEGPSRLERTRAGSIVFVDRGALGLIRGRREQRLLMDFRARWPVVRALARRGASMPVTVSRRCTVTLEVRDRGRRVLSVRRTLGAGRRRVRLPRAFPKGFPRGYALRAVARAGPRIATAGLNLNAKPDFSVSPQLIGSEAVPRNRPRHARALGRPGGRPWVLWWRLAQVSA